MDGTTLFDKLLTLRGLNPTSLAAAIQQPTAQSGFDRFRKGLISQPKRDGPLALAAKHLGVNVLAFYDQALAEQEWARISGNQPDATKGVENTAPGPDIRGKVPLISWVRAGEWCEAADPFHPGDAERWMDCPVNHSNSTFALRVRGDSMTAPHGSNRTYPEGCLIFVDPERRTPVNGERIVACMEGSHEVTFKVYKNEDGRQWLQPLNPSHEPIREPFKVLGTVLGKWEDG